MRAPWSRAQHPVANDNDNPGHGAGDPMLCPVADAWGREVPASALPARHGGDEFSLLLPRVTGPAALSLVRPVYVANPDLVLSCEAALLLRRQGRRP